ncbi:MAG: hypothetical protein LC721_08725 [Actinobacteria bacterium]|nr:hypothetical protein [Actinomycetota bacterium]
MAPVAECAVGTGAGSHDHIHLAAAADPTTGQAPSTLDGITPAGHHCHHDTRHQQVGTVDKLQASPRRLIDDLAADPAGPAAANVSAASALVLFGLRRRDPPSVSRSCPSGRPILISTCVART